MMNLARQIFLVGLLSLAMLSTGAADPRQERDFLARTQSIEALLNAYRGMAGESSDPGPARAFEHRVMAGLQQAQQLYLYEGYGPGRELLDRIYSDLKNAIVALRDGQTVVRNRASDEQYQVGKSLPRYATEYARLNDSIEALLDAYRRVAAEKGRQQQAAITYGNIQAIRARADQHYAAGGHDAGHDLLVGAYSLVKEALAALREGETLVQSVQFATPEEEYQYYLNKTQSQQTALDILLQVSDDPVQAGRIKGLLQASQAKVDEAAAEAAQQNFADANAIMDGVFTSLHTGLMMALSAR